MGEDELPHDLAEQRVVAVLAEALEDIKKVRALPTAPSNQQVFDVLTTSLQSTWVAIGELAKLLDLERLTRMALTQQRED